MDIRGVIKKTKSRSQKKKSLKNSYVVQFWDQPSRTIISHLYKDGNQFIHPDHNQERTLTVGICKITIFP